MLGLKVDLSIQIVCQELYPMDPDSRSFYVNLIKMETRFIELWF